MAIKKSVQETSDTSLFSIIGYKYLPYWPLFILLSFILLFFAFIYTKYLTPVYTISATLVINDEQKGVQESETLRSLNVYAANTIVENEIQVLTSRTLMKEAVANLHLYAPVFEKGRVKPAPAYLTSPVVVQAREPDRIKPQEKIDFEYNVREESVKIGNKHYPLYQWIRFPYGVIRFVKNPNQRSTSVRDMYFSLLNPKAVALGMGGSLEVGATSKLSSVINIQYTDAIPERGVDVVDHLLEAYNRTSIENNNRLAANTLQFVSERVRDVERELDSIEHRIQQYRTAEGIVDISQQGRLYLESVAESDRKAADINMQLAVLSQVENYVRSGVNRTGIVPTTLGINDPVLADLLQKLNDLELQYANLRTRIGENNPMVQSVENEIQKIRPNILNIVRNQRRQLQASAANYNRTSNQANATLRTLPQKERQLLDISREQAVKNEVYAFLLQREEEAELSNAATIADSRIVDRADASVEPVSSKRMIILIGALIGAIALSIGYVFLKESLTGNVLFRSAITKNSTVPIIAEVAYRRHRNKLAGMAADPVLSAQFLQLQAALGLYDLLQKKQKILVTSGVANEGKTFISNGPAISLAASGQRVALVDLNLHQPETTALHQLKEEKGVTAFIQQGTNATAIIRNTNFANLDVVPAGAGTRNAPALLLNDRLNELFQYLEAHYDYIVVDAPPVEITTDAFILSKYIDHTLFIVRHGYTPVTLLQKLSDNKKLDAIGAVSIVFNGIRPRGFLRKYYGYGYGFGHESVFTTKKYLASE